MWNRPSRCSRCRPLFRSLAPRSGRARSGGGGRGSRSRRSPAPPPIATRSTARLISSTVRRRRRRRRCRADNRRRSARPPAGRAISAPRARSPSSFGRFRLERAHRSAAADERDLQGGDHPGRGALGPVARRPDLGRLRPRGDHRRAGPGRSGGLHVVLPITHRDRRPAGHLGLLLPPGDRRLSGRRRRLRRVPGQPRARHQPGRRRVADRRLHPHRGRLHRRRGGGAHLGLPEPHLGHRPALPRHPALITVLNLRGWARPPGRSSCPR
jgi:hypothetical protein